MGGNPLNAPDPTDLYYVTGVKGHDSSGKGICNWAGDVINNVKSELPTAEKVGKAAYGRYKGVAWGALGGAAVGLIGGPETVPVGAVIGAAGGCIAGAAWMVYAPPGYTGIPDPVSLAEDVAGAAKAAADPVCPPGT